MNNTDTSLLNKQEEGTFNKNCFSIVNGREPCNQTIIVSMILYIESFFYF